jgi:hypothetical protein
VGGGGGGGGGQAGSETVVVGGVDVWGVWGGGGGEGEGGGDGGGAPHVNFIGACEIIHAGAPHLLAWGQRDQCVQTKNCSARVKPGDERPRGCRSPDGYTGEMCPSGIVDCIARALAECLPSHGEHKRGHRLLGKP